MGGANLLRQQAICARYTRQQEKLVIHCEASSAADGEFASQISTQTSPDSLWNPLLRRLNLTRGREPADEVRTANVEGFCEFSCRHY
ncbi:hypothetical protein M514_17752 [Trichuris suis]|uniref:Uncharacterized protein n=1 Tax=Trichuris suis TaxID=68888 RepID=A0A085NL04_9BILA|nr:hypothetical protein M514_17752 [Trichuris suis]